MENNKPELDMTPTKPDMKACELVVHDDGQFATLFDTARFNQAWRAATAFSKSKLVPAHFQGAPEACFIALDMAVRMDLHPFMLMQKLYIVHGRPGLEAQLVIALVNSRGPFKGPIQWEVTGEGDKKQWTAYAIHKETDERCEATVTMEMVKAEGWMSKEGSKWRSLPDLMGKYRSAVFLARLYCPEVILGLSTADELIDMNGDIIEAEPLPPPPEIEKKTQADKIKGELKGRKPKKETSPEPQEETKDPGPKESTAQFSDNPVDADTVAELKIYCDQAGLDPRITALMFTEDKKRDSFAAMTNSEAGRCLGYLLDQVSAKETAAS